MAKSPAAAVNAAITAILGPNRHSSPNNNDENNNNDDGNITKRKKCLFGWHPFTLFILLTTSFVLSTMSSLDCQFVSVHGIYYDESSDKTADNIGVGLWSFEEWIGDPIPRNKNTDDENNPESKVKAAQGWYNEMIRERKTTCVMYGKAYERGGLAFRTKNGDGVVSEEEEDVYKRWFVNGDVNWSISRIMAVFGFIFGFIANLAIWLMVCLGTKPITKEHLLFANICTFICEAIKGALFFNISFCHSITNPSPTSTHWFDGGAEDISATTSTVMDVMGNDGRVDRSCGFGRGSASSLTSTLLYFISLVFILVYHLRPKYQDEDEEDSMSIPMFLRTIQQRRNDRENNVNSNSSSRSRRISGDSRRSSGDTRRSSSEHSSERRRYDMEAGAVKNSSRRHLTRPPSRRQSPPAADNTLDDHHTGLKRSNSNSSVTAQNCVDAEERGLRVGGVSARARGRGQYVSRFVNIDGSNAGGRGRGRGGATRHSDVSTLTGNS